jgi:hypothetical protein
VRFREIAKKNGEVEVSDHCNSACTLILGHIPREHLCFGEHARLNLHKASNPDGTASMEYTTYSKDAEAFGTPVQDYSEALMDSYRPPDTGTSDCRTPG